MNNLTKSRALIINRSISRYSWAGVLDSTFPALSERSILPRISRDQEPGFFLSRFESNDPRVKEKSCIEVPCGESHRPDRPDQSGTGKQSYVPLGYIYSWDGDTLKGIPEGLEAQDTPMSLTISGKVDYFNGL